jgi:hypothetical protein
VFHATPRNTRAPLNVARLHSRMRMPRGNTVRGAWARDAHRTPREELGKEHHAHQANHAGNHANHAHHSETQAARTHSTGGIRIAANGRAYAHSGSMHQDGRRCMEVGTSNKWYTETASKQPAAHPPERPQNPAIQLITAEAHPPERPQNPQNHLITAGAHPRRQSEAHRAQRRS